MEKITTNGIGSSKIGEIVEFLKGLNYYKEELHEQSRFPKSHKQSELVKKILGFSEETCYVGFTSPGTLERSEPVISVVRQTWLYESYWDLFLDQGSVLKPNFEVNSPISEGGKKSFAAALFNYARCRTKTDNPKKNSMYDCMFFRLLLEISEEVWLEQINSRLGKEKNTAKTLSNYFNALNRFPPRDKIG